MRFPNPKPQGRRESAPRKDFLTWIKVLAEIVAKFRIDFPSFQNGSIPMAIAVVIEFPGARSRAKYEKSVQLILKGKRKRLADWPVKGVLAHIAGPMPGGWRGTACWQCRC